MTVGAAQATLTAADVRGQVEGRASVTGKLVVTGTAPRAGTYCDQRARGKTARSRASRLTLRRRAHSRDVHARAKFLPGAYDIALVPGRPGLAGDPGRATGDARRTAAGVVDVAFLSGARNGTAARTLTGATTIWASFHFAAKPKGTLTLTWYKLGKKRVRIGSTTRTPPPRS